MRRPIALALLLFALSWPVSALSFTRTVQTVLTADGVALVGYHYDNPGAQPVVIFHGLGSNIFSVDLPLGRHSLAVFLANRGYDVWVLNLRGQGSGDIRSSNPDDWDWSVDDYALRDVPAVVDYVRAATGQKPFLMGHSMGGMILYAYLQGARLVDRPDLGGTRVQGSATLARQRQAGVKGLITISSPPRVRWKYNATLFNFFLYPPEDTNILLTVASKSDKVRQILDSRSNIPVADIIDWLESDLASFPYFGQDLSDYIFWLVSNLADNGWLAMVANPDNVTPETLDVALRWAIDSASTKVVKQFCDAVNFKTFREFHVDDPGRRPYVYADHYDRITVPALVMAGTKDFLACDDTVKQYGYMKLGSRDKTYIAMRNYGHGDILIGEKAVTQVYPKILTWLRNHP
jgi:pimeloyl-ACP methyl ester carboxylesterase